MAEVSEKQFNLIKQFCKYGTGLVMCPIAMESDGAEMIQASATNVADLAALADGGFLTDFTNEFIEAYRTNIGGNPPRPVKAYIITKMAYDMFGPKDTEGMVN